MPVAEGLDVRRALRQTDYWATVYARTWRGSVISSFVMPLFYVVAMGVLLGGFVEADPADLEGAPSYLAFVIPGMLAAQVMTTVFGEVTYPVMSGIKWHKTYYGMIATPLSAADIAFGQLGYVLFRVATVSAVFLAVLAPFGLIDSFAGALGAFAVQVLVGLAFAAPVFAFSASLQDESAFALVFRLGMIPMFLFSGAFFPITNLSPWMEWLARITPLWHGVDLTRMLMLGTVDLSMMVVHLVYLAALAALGWFLGVRVLHRRLVS